MRNQFAPHLHCRQEAVREAFSPWKGIEHRLEHVAEKDGVRYVNDSKATNVNAAWMALEHMRTPVVWLAGGHMPMGDDWRELCDLVKGKVKAVYFLGDLPPWFVRVYQPCPVLQTASMREAVLSAQVFAEPGDTVLMSPGTASFNWYQDLEERGRSFKLEVGRL